MHFWGHIFKNILVVYLCSKWKVAIVIQVFANPFLPNVRKHLSIHCPINYLAETLYLNSVLLSLDTIRPIRISCLVLQGQTLSFLLYICPH